MASGPIGREPVFILLEVWFGVRPFGRPSAKSAHRMGPSICGSSSPFCDQIGLKTGSQLAQHGSTPGSTRLNTAALVRITRARTTGAAAKNRFLEPYYERIDANASILALRSPVGASHRLGLRGPAPRFESDLRSDSQLVAGNSPSSSLGGLRPPHSSHTKRAASLRSYRGPLRGPSGPPFGGRTFW